MSHTYRIAVGVDGSAGGLRALRWACREAATRDAVVDAVIVWTWDPANATELGYLDQQRIAAEDTLGTAIVQALNDNPRVAVRPHVIVDEPARGLILAAKDADILVLGSHGHGHIYHALLGSVAEACIRAATCPIVVIPAAREDHDKQDRTALAAVAG